MSCSTPLAVVEAQDYLNLLNTNLKMALTKFPDALFQIDLKTDEVAFLQCR